MERVGRNLTKEVTVSSYHTRKISLRFYSELLLCVGKHKISKPVENCHEFIRVYLSQRTLLETRAQGAEENASQNDSLQFVLYF